MAEPERPQLKKIDSAAIAAALERAEHYRLLNDPEPAESICLDILEVEPDNQKARVLLVLSLTDQFKGGGQGSVKRARAAAAELSDEYQRVYYGGLIHERQARAWLDRGKSEVFAYDAFRDAMDAYEAAGELSPEGKADPILRWNSCVRAIERHGLKPLEDPGDMSMLE